MEIEIVGTCPICKLYIWGDPNLPPDDLICPDPECKSHPTEAPQ